jgi:multicomponent Na+:H+ antiporter subunit D
MLTSALDALLLGSVLTPFAAYFGKRLGLRRAREGFVVLSFAIALLLLLSLYPQFSGGITVIAFSTPPLAGCLEIDALGALMAITAISLALLCAIYSVRYMDRDSGLTQYYTLLGFMMAGVVGVAFSGDLFTLYVFWELMSITSYALVAFRKDQPTSIEAGFKFLIMSAFGTSTILLAMSFLYGLSGTLNFAQLALALHTDSPSPWLQLVFSMLVVGFGVKAAIVPLHTWLPDAHPEAPSPVSALLSGIIIETGLYGLVRLLLLLFDPVVFALPLGIVAIATMTVANLTALLQRDIKRLLAYSSIAQMGYMLIGVSVGTQYGLQGAFLHIFNHALMKGLAFLAVGAIIYRIESRDIDSMRGIGKYMPITTFALAISLLGLGGIPFTNGFVSKYILFMSAFGAGEPLLAIAGILNSAFSVVYYVRALQTLLAKPLDEEKVKVKEAPLAMLIPMCAIAALVVFFGIWPAPAMDMANRAATSLLELGRYVRAIFPAS